MKTIYKYPLTSRDCTLTLPAGAEILTVKLQNDIPTLWAIVDTDEDLNFSRHICIVGTGWGLGDNMEYITTYLDGPFVWHVFEINE